MKGPSFLPTAAQRPVNLDHGEHLVAKRADQTQLRTEQLLLTIEDFEVTRNAAAIPDVGESGRLAGRGRQRLLLRAKLAALSIFDESVRDFTERLENRLPILLKGRLGIRAREVHARADAAGVEDRQRDRGADREEALRAER